MISEDSDGVISDFNEQYSMDADNGLGLLALVASGVSRGSGAASWISFYLVYLV